MKTLFKVVILLTVAGFSLSSPAIDTGDLRQCVDLSELRDSAIEFRLLTTDQNACINNLNRMLSRSESLKGAPQANLALTRVCYAIDFFDGDERLSFTISTQKDPNRTYYKIAEFCDMSYGIKTAARRRDKVLKAFDREVKAKVVGDVVVDKEVEAVIRYFDRKDADSQYSNNDEL